MTHICFDKLTIIGSDNGLSPGWRQAIISSNAGILLIGPLGTNFSEILIKIYTFSFNEMHLKLLSSKRRPFCLGLNVLINGGQLQHIASQIWVNISLGKSLLPNNIKPLPEPMLTYCQLYFLEQIWMKFDSKYKHFHFHENFVCKTSKYICYCLATWSVAWIITIVGIV